MSQEQAVQKRHFGRERHVEGTGAWSAAWGTANVSATHLSGINAR